MDDVAKITPANILILLQFVAPGFLIVYFRSLFVTRRQAAFKDNLLFFVTVSVIYGFLALPLAPAFATAALTGHYLKWLAWALVLILLPILLGILAGVAVQRGWIKKVMTRFRLQPVSPYPTGWDWSFSQLDGPTYLIVTLDDGTQIAGLFGERSLAASDLANKDIFIEELYDLAESIWTARPAKQGILISGKSIRHIEFMPSRSETTHVEQL
jgi:hypothetical protein